MFEKYIRTNNLFWGLLLAASFLTLFNAHECRSHGSLPNLALGEPHPVITSLLWQFFQTILSFCGYGTYWVVSMQITLSGLLIFLDYLCISWFFHVCHILVGGGMCLKEVNVINSKYMVSDVACRMLSVSYIMIILFQFSIHWFYLFSYVCIRYHCFISASLRVANGCFDCMWLLRCIQCDHVHVIFLYLFISMYRRYCPSVLVDY